MIDSFLFFIHNKGYFDKTITQADVPASLPLNLTSDHLDMYFPGFLKRYGPNEPVSVRLNTYVAPEAIIKDSQIGGLVQFDIHLICKEEDAIVGRVVNGKAAASIEFKNFNLTVQITAFQLDDLIQHESKIGDQDLHAIADFINTASYLVLPFLNFFIPNITIPQLIDGVEIEQASFTATDNYLYLTFSPIYHGMSEIYAEKLRQEISTLHQDEKELVQE